MNKENDIKISVLIPVYNVEQLLPRCLDSILNQTMADIEVVAVNDASPDGSAAVLERYASRDPRVRVITKSVNEGLMMARKTGYENARGRYLFFCDSDDYLPADALAALYKKAVEAGSDITVGAMYLENGDGRHVLKPREHVAGETTENYLRAILNWTTCSLCGTLFARRLFEGREYETFMHQSYSEDRLLLTLLLLGNDCRVATIPSATYYYYLNQGSITHSMLSNEAIGQQLTALFRSHGYVNEAGVMPVDNDRFIVRYLSLYIERGYPLSLVRDFNETSRRLLKLSPMCRVTSLRFALHTLGCMYCAPYRVACHRARLVIRKLQGKD